MIFSHPDIQAFVKRALLLHSRRDPKGSQSKRLTVDDLVNRRTTAGDRCTFELRVGDFEIFVDANATIGSTCSGSVGDTDPDSENNNGHALHSVLADAGGQIALPPPTPPHTHTHTSWVPISEPMKYEV